MKTIQTVLGCWLTALLAGPLQVSCLVEIRLGMSNDSVDDQYLECGPGGESELRASGGVPLEEGYWETWEKAERHWEGLGLAANGFDPLYGVAIVAYTVGDALYADFNAAARDAGKSQHAYDCYPFRDFHLLLTKALQVKRTERKCYEVFRGVKGVRFAVGSDEAVRFGQFASSSSDENVAKAFGQDTFFSIRTCHGVPIDDFSYHPGQKEVLIPPYEAFDVAERRVGEGVFVRLESHGLFSRCNCGVLKGGSKWAMLRRTAESRPGRNDECAREPEEANPTPNAARLSTPPPMPYLLWGLLLTSATLESLGSF